MFGLFVATLIGAAGGSICAWRLAQETQEPLEELLAKAATAYEDQARHQADIDRLFSPCSPQWVRASAEGAVKTVSAITEVSDRDSAMLEVEDMYDRLCTNGDKEEFCGAYPQWLNRWTSTEAHEPIESEIQRCLDLLGLTGDARVAVVVGDCVAISGAEAEPTDCQNLNHGTATGVFELQALLYPGEEAARQEARTLCDSTSPGTLALFPSAVSWALYDDHRIVCVLRAEHSLKVGDCVVYAERVSNRMLEAS